MKQLYMLMLTLLLTICGSVTADTHVGGELEGEVVWDLDGSPYIVDESIEFGEDGADLIIEPGVTVMFTDFEGIYSEHGGSVTAEGTPDDSIFFIPTPLDARWSGIWIGGDSLTSGIFDYCYFYRAYGHHESYAVLRGFYGSLEVRHSTFIHASTLINVNAEYPVIEDCLFGGHIINGIIPNPLMPDSAVIRRCVFLKNISPGYWVGTFRGIIDHCLFYGVRVGAGSRNTPGGTITNNIFIADSLIHIQAISSFPINVSYNIVFNWESIVDVDNGIEDVGVIDRINANGDSTDVYGNLIMEPLLVDSDDFPDMYFLTEASPCIDAGDPDSDPDPDGTITDIGRYFFPQQNIAVEPDTILFETPGTIDSAAVTIRNIGLTTLTITSQTITPDDSPFTIDDDVGEVEVEPQSEFMTWVQFIPNEAGLYEAVLVIESDDPDEEIVEIPLIGTSLNVTDETDNPPADFSILAVHPNPFNAATTIAYSLPWYSHMSLTVHDVNGRIVETLVNDNLMPGMHTAILSSDNLASGIYIIRLAGAGKLTTRKILLIR